MTLLSSAKSRDSVSGSIESGKSKSFSKLSDAASLPSNMAISLSVVLGILFFVVFDGLTSLSPLTIINSLDALKISETEKEPFSNSSSVAVKPSVLTLFKTPRLLPSVVSPSVR